MIDLWARMKGLFVTEIDLQPEIEIVQMSESTMRTILEFLLHNSRTVNTRCFTFLSDEPVPQSSGRVLIDKLVEGELMGLVLCDVAICGYNLPLMGFTTDEPGYMMLQYDMGPQWTPVGVMALFEFFRMIIAMDRSAKIRLNHHMFDPTTCSVFDAVLKEYVSEKQ